MQRVVRRRQKLKACVTETGRKAVVYADGRTGTWEHLDNGVLMGVVAEGGGEDVERMAEKRGCGVLLYFDGTVGELWEFVKRFGGRMTTRIVKLTRSPECERCGKKDVLCHRFEVRYRGAEIGIGNVCHECYDVMIGDVAL